jgi:hypothetical protein
MRWMRFLTPSAIVSRSDKTFSHGSSIDLRQADSWTAIKIHPAAVAIMLKVFQRMFVGKELSRNPEWVSSDSALLIFRIA